jgi:hypothetical protein
MRNGLVGGFALVANKGEEFGTDICKTKLWFLETAIGTNAIAWQTSQFAHFLLCRTKITRHGVIMNDLKCLSLFVCFSRREGKTIE